MADPVRLEVFKSMYSSVAEEMGISLRRSAFSPNIKERRDYSCAVFNKTGILIAQGDHMPVHLGSMPMSVAAALANRPLTRGDVAVLNDPYAGGTHLPDVTLIAPVFVDGPASSQQRFRRKPLFYVANRAHHSDIGGANPGSMGLASDIYQEGVRIPPALLMSGGRLNADLMNLILANVRLPREREGDLTAQLGSAKTGQTRLLEIVERYGPQEADLYASLLIDYAHRMMSRIIDTLPDGVYQAEDFLDDDGWDDTPIRIRVKIKIRGDRATVDFSGTNRQVRGPVNAVEAIAVSAVFYVFRCLIPTDVPASWGIMRAIDVITETGTLVAATPPVPVAAGNVETSQRIVDTLLLALSQCTTVPAASQGTMNNLTVGGQDHRTGLPFAYYETIAGGMGGRAGLEGISGVHSNMTNSLNTPAEALEYAYPMRIRRYSIRKGSGGAGRYRGGDGIVREIELLTDAAVNILSDRRKTRPYGLKGGEPGSCGVNTLFTSGGQERPVKGKETVYARAGDIIRVATPGGGGYGSPTARS
ncbi:MAG TPA: hydantoinase B/oxoprolinase family protein [Blastocatellia bacterium]|nr:hydantoinase B/oxoprolinase family protein [Blastocatellia bacterium]